MFSRSFALFIILTSSPRRRLEEWKRHTHPDEFEESYARPEPPKIVQIDQQYSASILRDHGRKINSGMFIIVKSANHFRRSRRAKWKSRTYKVKREHSLYIHLASHLEALWHAFSKRITVRLPLVPPQTSFRRSPRDRKPRDFPNTDCGVLYTHPAVVRTFSERTLYF
ncbi:hypothetical protein CEXT_219361 [Caerostris extrusa]|uniref:Secreted protein n=1 Tax=Caerostris extrusa TaxID=172846 RepID=A0AAV4UHN4_CAEEX|nr:hypothetical protein CEXT_219361 [Caerostris extrusa]